MKITRQIARLRLRAYYTDDPSARLAEMAAADPDHVQWRPREYDKLLLDPDWSQILTKRIPPLPAKLARFRPRWEAELAIPDFRQSVLRACIGDGTMAGAGPVATLVDQAIRGPWPNLGVRIDFARTGLLEFRVYHAENGVDDARGAHAYLFLALLFYGRPQYLRPAAVASVVRYRRDACLLYMANDRLA